MPRTAEQSETLLTVADVAARLVVGEAQVLDLIHSGRLTAVNVGLGAQRPRWRLTPEAIDTFLASRATPSRPPARRRKQTAQHVTEFFQ